ncbi:hypothetical protein BH23BAC1_BH23BAC1_16140 [soil metagenome]
MVDFNLIIALNFEVKLNLFMINLPLKLLGGLAQV